MYKALALIVFMAAVANARPVPNPSIWESLKAFVSDAAKDVADKTKDFVGDAWDKTKDAVGDAWDQAKDIELIGAIGNTGFGEKVGETVGKVVDFVDDKLDTGDDAEDSA